MRSLSVFILLFSFVSFAGEVGDKLPEQNKVHAVNLKNGAWQETCLPSEYGMIIEYDFESSQTLNFNIHWHKNKVVTYSVKHEGIKKLKGSFEPSVQQTFCLSWYESDKKELNFTYKYSHKKIKKKK
ncbi:MAG: hypothetical protein AAF203_06940 [Pseudomonadota bacterium]